MIISLSFSFLTNDFYGIFLYYLLFFFCLRCFNILGYLQQRQQWAVISTPTWREATARTKPNLPSPGKLRRRPLDLTPLFPEVTKSRSIYTRHIFYIYTITINLLYDRIILVTEKKKSSTFTSLNMAAMILNIYLVWKYALTDGILKKTLGSYFTKSITAEKRLITKS